MNQSHSNIQTQCKIRKEKVNVKEMTTRKKSRPLHQSASIMVQWCHGEMAKRIKNSMKGIDISEQRIGKKKFKILTSSNSQISTFAHQHISTFSQFLSAILSLQSALCLTLRQTLRPLVKA